MDPSEAPIPDSTPPPPAKSSVVIVSRNCAGPLRRCLAALEQSTIRPHFEVIVVDSGSRDSTPQLEEEFPGVTFMRLPRNFGNTRARNIGSRTATGEFLLYLDPRVEVQPDTVEKLVRGLESHPDAVAVNPLLTDAAGQTATRLFPFLSPKELYAIWQRRAWPAPRPVNTAEPTNVEWIPLQALLLRAQFLRGMNYFDERFSHYWSDLELCFQIRRGNKKNLLLPDVQATLHPEGDEVIPSAARGLLSADQALGAAAYTGKHFGWLAGARFHLAASFGAFGGFVGSLLRARDIRFHSTRFTAIVSSQRIDGSQSSL